jgi:hypothetical protein
MRLMNADGVAAGRGTPPAEVTLDEASVAALLAERRPDLSGLPCVEEGP